MERLNDASVSFGVNNVKMNTTTLPSSITSQSFIMAQYDEDTINHTFQSPGLAPPSANVPTGDSQSTILKAISSVRTQNVPLRDVTTIGSHATVAGVEGGDDDGAWKVAVGVSVPLIIILVSVLIVAYILYRRKYPVRMIIGRHFSKYRNPDYNQPRSNATLVREDADAYFSESSTSVVMNMNEMQLTNSPLEFGRENLGYQQGDEEVDDSDGGDYEDIRDREFLSKKSWLFPDYEDSDGSQIVNEYQKKNVDTGKATKKTETGTAGSEIDSDMSDIETMLAEQQTTPIPERRQRKPSISSNDETNCSETSLGGADDDVVNENAGDLDLTDNSSTRWLHREHTFTDIRELRSQSLTAPPVEVTSKSRSFSFDLLKSARNTPSKEEPITSPDIFFHSNNTMNFGPQKITASVVSATVQSRSITSSLSSIPSTSMRNATASFSSVNSNPHLVTDLDDSDVDNDSDKALHEEKALPAGDTQGENMSCDSKTASDVPMDLDDFNSTPTPNNTSEEIDDTVSQRDIKKEIPNQDNDEEAFLEIVGDSSKVDEAVYETAMYYTEKQGRSFNEDSSDHLVSQTPESDNQTNRFNASGEFAFDQDAVYEDTSVEYIPQLLNGQGHSVMDTSESTLTTIISNTPVVLEDPAESLCEDTTIQPIACVTQKNEQESLEEENIMMISGEHESDDLIYEDTSQEHGVRSFLKPEMPSGKIQSDSCITLRDYDLDEVNDLYEDMCDCHEFEEPKDVQFKVGQSPISAKTQTFLPAATCEDPSDNIYDNALPVVQKATSHEKMETKSGALNDIKDIDAGYSVSIVQRADIQNGLQAKKLEQEAPGVTDDKIMPAVDDGSDDSADDSDGNSSSTSKSSSDGEHLQSNYSFNQDLGDSDGHDEDDDVENWNNTYPSQRPPFLSESLSSIEEETSPDASHKPELSFQGHSTEGHQAEGDDRFLKLDAKEYSNEKSNSVEMEQKGTHFQHPNNFEPPTEILTDDLVSSTNVGQKKSVSFDTSVVVDNDTASSISSNTQSSDVDDISLSDIEEPSDLGTKYQTSSSSSSSSSTNSHPKGDGMHGDEMIGNQYKQSSISIQNNNDNVTETGSSSTSVSGLKIIPTIQFSDESSDSADEQRVSTRPVLNSFSDHDTNKGTLLPKTISSGQDEGVNHPFTIGDIDDVLSTDDVFQSKVQSNVSASVGQKTAHDQDDDLNFSFEVTRKYRVRPDDSDDDIDV